MCVESGVPSDPDIHGCRRCVRCDQVIDTIVESIYLNAMVERSPEATNEGGGSPERRHRKMIQGPRLSVCLQIANLPYIHKEPGDEDGCYSEGPLASVARCIYEEIARSEEDGDIWKARCFIYNEMTCVDDQEYAAVLSQNYYYHNLRFTHRK